MTVQTAQRLRKRDLKPGRYLLQRDDKGNLMFEIVRVLTFPKRGEERTANVAVRDVREAPDSDPLWFHWEDVRHMEIIVAAGEHA